VATSRSPDSSTASAMSRPKPLALPVTNHTLFIKSCLSSLVPNGFCGSVDVRFLQFDRRVLGMVRRFY